MIEELIKGLIFAFVQLASDSSKTVEEKAAALEKTLRQAIDDLNTGVAEEIAEVTGREIRYVPISIEEYATAATEQGLPGEVVDLLRYLFGVVLDGRNARVTNGVQRALGRPPRDFSDYTRTTAATGVWAA